MEHCECNVRVPAFYESVDFAVLEVDNTFTRVAKGKKSVWRRCWDWSKSCYGFNEGRRPTGHELLFPEKKQ